MLVFTNLTQDHLDFHGTMEAYFEAKRRLFAQAERAVVNVGDEYGRRLAAELPDAITFDAESDALDGIELKLPRALQPRERDRRGARGARARRSATTRSGAGIESVARRARPLRGDRRGAALRRRSSTTRTRRTRSRTCSRAARGLADGPA